MDPQMKNGIVMLNRSPKSRKCVFVVVPSVSDGKLGIPLAQRECYTGTALHTDVQNVQNALDTGKGFGTGFKNFRILELFIVSVRNVQNVLLKKRIIGLD